MIPIQYKTILFLFLNITILNAQETMIYTKEELNAKNKSELVEIALTIIREKHPEIIVQLSDFDGRVWESEYVSFFCFLGFAQHLSLHRKTA